LDRDCTKKKVEEETDGTKKARTETPWTTISIGEGDFKLKKNAAGMSNGEN